MTPDALCALCTNFCLVPIVPGNNLLPELAPCSCEVWFPKQHVWFSRVGTLVVWRPPPSTSTKTFVSDLYTKHAFSSSAILGAGWLPRPSHQLSQARGPPPSGADLWAMSYSLWREYHMAFEFPSVHHIRLQRGCSFSGPGQSMLGFV